MNSNKPNIFLAVIFSILMYIFFNVVYAISAFIIILIFGILNLIPIISNIVEYIFELRGDSPGILTYFVSPILSYQLTKCLVGIMSKNNSTKSLTLLLTGILIILVIGMSTVISLINNEHSVIDEIVQIITGIVFIINRNKFED